MLPPRQLGTLTIGPAPAVVGVATRADTVAGLGVRPPRCDVVELRADLIGPALDSAIDSIHATSPPLLLTIRSAREGGRWAGTEAERVARFAALLPRVEAIDIEIESEAFAPVVAAAKAAGRCVVASFHDFSSTPESTFLIDLIERGARAGADILKIAVWTAAEEEIRRLETLFHQAPPVPLAVMGMGPLGVASRMRLAAAGSCLVYGYIDEATAPGQLSAAEWVDRLMEQLPAYRAAHAHV